MTPDLIDRREVIAKFPRMTLKKFTYIFFLALLVDCSLNMWHLCCILIAVLRLHGCSQTFTPASISCRAAVVPPDWMG
jgi:hypothetical protein